MNVPGPEVISCCICGATDPAVYLDGGEQELSASNIGSSRTTISFGCILRCPHCGFAFRRLRPSDRELAVLYTEADARVYERETHGRVRTAIRHARIVERYRCQPGRLLDVGCASGSFLSEMAAKKWSVEGVEPSQHHAQHAREAVSGRGRVQQTILQEAQFARLFDVVTLWDVLEHVPDPIGFLVLCIGLLEPGGYLFLNVPDLGSLQARLLGRRWPLLLAEHLNYFDLRSLRDCASRAGFMWVATGRRPASFSLEYITYRLSQHGLPLMAWSSRRLERSQAGRLTVPVWMGERYAILQKPAPPGTAQQVKPDDRGKRR